MTKFCDICGCEILCTEELGRVDTDIIRLKGPFGKPGTGIVIKNKTTICALCCEYEEHQLEEFLKSDEARVDAEFDEWAKGQA